MIIEMKKKKHKIEQKREKKGGAYILFKKQICNKTKLAKSKRKA